MHFFVLAIVCNWLYYVAVAANEPTLNNSNSAMNKETTKSSPAVLKLPTSSTTTFLKPTKNNIKATNSPKTTTAAPAFSTTTHVIAKISQSVKVKVSISTTTKTPPPSSKPTPASSTEKKSTTSTPNKPLIVKKVPNPEAGLRVVIIFLAVVAFSGAIFLTYLFIKKHRRRRLYQQPSTMRTGPSENVQFENPIQFPPATYGNAVI